MSLGYLKECISRTKSYQVCKHFIVKTLRSDNLYQIDEKGHSKEASITFFESPSHTITTTRDVEVETAVWEIDNADHRGVIQADMFLRELREELSYYFNREKVGPRPKFDVKHRFASKRERIPRIEEDCVWDYLSGRSSFLFSETVIIT